MSLSAQELAKDLDFFAEILGYTREMVSTYDENQRVCSVFASQQRWLMALAGFGLYYGGVDGESPGIHANRFASYVVDHEIASHNTALSFLHEMLADGFLRYLPIAPDRRARPMEPTEEAILYMTKWLGIHLAVLDRLDGGKRSLLLARRPDIVATLQPAISAAIINSHDVREPGDTFDLFTSANSGGVIMDYLISRVGLYDSTTHRAIVGRIAFTDICQRFLISRTHAKRLMHKAAAMQSIGWTGSPGRSQLWLSCGFLQEYRNFQAEKFALIEAAWKNAFGPLQIRPTKQKQSFTSAIPSR